MIDSNDLHGANWTRRVERTRTRDEHRAARQKPQGPGEEMELDTGSRSWERGASTKDKENERGGRHRSHRSRSRSPRRDKDRHHHHHKSHHRSSHSPHKNPKEPAHLPNNAPHISTRHYTFYASLFASYLDIQKGLRLDDLDEKERKGRFKAFVKHWNRGELAEGWYDPDRKAKCDALRAEILEEDVPEEQRGGRKRRGSPVYEDVRRTPPPPQPQREREEKQLVRRQEEESESEDEFGPWVPGMERKKALATLPTAADLDAQNEAIRESRALERADLTHNRKLDRKAQKAALDELVPRADPGTRERQLEKKKEVNAKMREFRNKSPGAELEVAESTLMGEGGEESFKAKKAAMERKKNERELRKEAMLRERIREREERLEEARRKEEKTMGMLVALRDSMLAKQRG
ncbi:hypothetical protein BJ508DRAFT_360372 [Ascobolus immersus RN42]|uniref:Uncharacterized protein n=1 Tax=Ascobolus immersus RN42 TaxID=1160509 RepID=A0A3N4IC65_ASCIM|nr:hypothetical protein BJ508DRAFT_360372 [Ascobolus immersus RN42]